MCGGGKCAVCIAASNRISSQDQSASHAICKRVQELLAQEKVCCRLIDMGEFDLKPCIGCGQCMKSGKCMVDRDFNKIYESISRADWCLIVSSRYTPIPAELCILLGKMEQINILAKTEQGGRSHKLEGKLAGIISHSSTDDREPESCKTMVNDTIANALDILRMRVVPFNSKWDTGIALSLSPERKERKTICSAGGQGEAAEERLKNYIKVITQTARTLYALR